MRGLRDAARRLWFFSSSRATSMWVIGAWLGLWLVWLLPFHFAGMSEDTLTAIGEKTLAFRAVYAAVLATTLACTLRRVRRDLKRGRGWIEPATTSGVPVDRAVSIDQITESLQAEGFELRREGASVTAVRNRWSALGGSVFHLSLLVIALGLYAHSAASWSYPLRVTEGQTVGEALAQVGPAQQAPSAVRSLQDLSLVSLAPQYFRDVLLFSRLDATVERAGRRSTFSLSSPLWLDPVTILRVQDFGLAPRFQVIVDGKILQDSVVSMRLFPPGTQDSATLESRGLVVDAVAFPDHGVVAGRDVSLSYNISNPRLLASVRQDSAVPQKYLARALLAPGESVQAGPVSVRFVGFERFGSFQVTRSWGMPILLIGGMLLVGGLAWRVLWPRIDLVVWEDDGLHFESRVDLRSRAEALRYASRWFASPAQKDEDRA